MRCVLGVSGLTNISENQTNKQTISEEIAKLSYAVGTLYTPNWKIIIFTFREKQYTNAPSIHFENIVEQQ